MKKWLMVVLVVVLILLVTAPTASSRGHGRFWAGVGVGILAGPFIWGPPAWGREYSGPRHFRPHHYGCPPYDYRHGWGQRYEYYRDDYYSPPRVWVPAHWEERWNYGYWERIWIPGHWRYGY